LQTFILFILEDYSLLYVISFSLFFFVSFCFIAKQRIDSGFFLFEAERKKKEIKKKNKKILKKCREAMESSDDDFS